MENPDIVSSFGAGTFSLEHNAPIYHHFADFGVQLQVAGKRNLDVYYDYDVAEGISVKRASHWVDQLNEAAADIPAYNSAGWVPRELLLCMLSVMKPHELREQGLALRGAGGIPLSATLPDVLSRGWDANGRDCRIVINRLNGCVVAMRDKAATLFDYCYDSALELDQVRSRAPMLVDRLTSRSAD